MITYSNFVIAIETLRVSKKFTIYEFIDGIMSHRNYDRFLKNESNISTETLRLMLEKLDITLDVFIEYLRNITLLHHPEEYNIVTNILTRHYKEANKIYKELDEDYEYNSVFSKYSLPICAAILQYKSNIITRDVMYEKIKNIINVEDFNNTSMINDDIVFAACIYSTISKKEDSEKLIAYFFKLIKDKNINLLLTFDEYAMATVYISLINIISFRADKLDKHFFIYICNEFYTKYVNIYTYYDLMFYRALYDFYKQFFIKNELTTYLYISSILSYGKENLPSKIYFTYTKDDFDIFYKLMNSPILKSEKISKGIFYYE